jgi:lipoate-protein ligase A
MLIVKSQSTEVYRNLAVEEWLLDHAERLRLQASPRQTACGPILFLCVNDPCVVIGKNQNPWRECRLSLMEQEGVPLARRISGGGAVYHDPGNLNVGIIVPRTEYREDKQYELIFQTLQKFGIHASKVRKNSLVVEELKFSGQAFCFRGQHVLHHGTLLVTADLKRLGRYLGPEVDGIETKAVASVPAAVANLSAFAPDLTVEKLSDSLVETFQMAYEPGDGVECWSDADVEQYAGTQFLPRVGKNSSKDWKLCHTPKFTFRGMDVEKGRVSHLDGNPLFDEWLEHLT